MAGKQTCFVESSDNDSKKLVEKVVPESTKDVYARFNCNMNTIYNEIIKPLSMLVGMLAERTPSKFHICPRGLASRPNIHFSDTFLGVYLLDITFFVTLLHIAAVR